MRPPLQAELHEFLGTDGCTAKPSAGNGGLGFRRRTTIAARSLALAARCHRRLLRK